MPRLEYEYVEEPQHLDELCQALSACRVIAFDTEFVSEDTYRPHLCLIQVAADDILAVIDPLAVSDINAFWELIARPGHTTVVHAGREEFRFCRHAIGRRPADWFDTQIAAAFVGLEYPAAYHNLVSKLLRKQLGKGETRTDWRVRPLSERQIEYALQDVIYLDALRAKLQRKLTQLERDEWLAEELEAWQRQVEDYDDREQWQRVSGINGLSPRGLAIVRELWRWREQEAGSRNRPPKRVLRDDLIVELARRESGEARSIRAVRGFERSNIKRHVHELAERIETALSLDEDELPRSNRRNNNHSNYTLLGQFLNTALGCICRSSDLAPTLVGTVQDVRDLISYRLDGRRTADEPPALMQGWRADVVGQKIDNLLQGKTAIRVSEPKSEQPLEFVPPKHPSDDG